MPKTFEVKLVRGAIKANKAQSAVLAGLNLRRINTVRELPDTPAIRGMVRKVAHLLEVKG